MVGGNESFISITDRSLKAELLDATQASTPLIIELLGDEDLNVQFAAVSTLSGFAEHGRPPQEMLSCSSR